MKKKTAAVIISMLCAAIVVLGVTALTQYEKVKEYQLSVDMSYQHAFGELLSSLSGMDTSLQKSLLATSPGMAGAVCTEVFGKAMTAQMALGMLPFLPVELEQTAGFISRVGDYAFVLSRNAARSIAYTDEEKETLRALSDTATILYQNFLSLQTDMSDGRLTMGTLANIQERMEAATSELELLTVGDGIKLIEREFPEIPILIYDGPFSEHLTNATPVMLEGMAEVDESEALKAAAKFFGLRESRIYLSGTCEGDIPCYYFTAETDGGEMTLGVSARGAKPVNMLCSRTPGEPTISAGDAVSKAAQFLAQQGFSNMRESYHMTHNGTTAINFAYEQDGVICYSDLIKVTIALDTGRVCGFESRGYLMNHRQRDIPAPAVTADAARQSVPPELEVVSESIALVPTGGGNELLCFEFVCQAQDGRKYIIYANAETGEQEKLLVLLEDDSGSLTI